MNTASSPWSPDSPFLSGYTQESASFTLRPADFLASTGSPFVTEYETDGEPEVDPAAESLDELLDEMHVEELDEAVDTLIQDVQESFAASDGDQGESFDALINEYLAPLVRRAEAEVDRVTLAAKGLGNDELAAGGLDEAVDDGEADPSTSPAFEFFLKGWRKKLKKIVKKAAAFGLGGPVGGLLISTVLPRLKVLVRPLLAKVVKLAQNKVPEPYRPLVRQLAISMGARASAFVNRAARKVAKDVADAAGDVAGAPDPGQAPVPTDPSVPDVGQAQQEFDQQLAETLLAKEAVAEEIPSEHRTIAVSARDPFAELARARARFVAEIADAEDAEQAQPVIERFLPAVMTAVRLGVKLAGRPKVVGLLGGLIAKLIAPMIGKKTAPSLGKVIADLGLRTFLQAEAGDEEAAMGETLAATVEETVRRAATLPEAVLDSGPVLEAYAREAFEGAVAANFPTSLVRPDLRESEAPAAWVLLPRRPARGRYRRFSRVFDISITPQTAAAVSGYGSSTLAGYFRDCLRLPSSAPVAARVRIYEAVPGTRLASIAREEDHKGLGSGDVDAWSQLMPLTPEAAGLLLGAPRLGRELAEDADPRVPAVGQRFYHLEVLEAPARPIGKESHFHLTVDHAKEQVRLCLYLSEVLAQRVAAALRTKKGEPSEIVSNLRNALAPMTAVLRARRFHRIVRVAGAAAGDGAQTKGGAVWRATRRSLRRQFGHLALQWAWTHLAQNLDKQAADFVAKAEAAADGVRLAFVFHLTGGMRDVARVFRGQAAPATDVLPKAPTRTELTLHAGPSHG